MARPGVVCAAPRPPCFCTPAVRLVQPNPTAVSRRESRWLRGSRLSLFLRPGPPFARAHPAPDALDDVVGDRIPQTIALDETGVADGLGLRTGLAALFLLREEVGVRVLLARATPVPRRPGATPRPRRP